MENCLIINGLHSTANCGRALAGVVPPHGLPTRFTISTISRQTVKTRISCSLKRFLRTTGQKTVTTCAENVLTRTPKQVVNFSIYKIQSRPRRGWCRWRFAALIPSGCRLTPIHKVMGDHASSGTTPAGASPPHGLFTMFIPDGFFRWAFQVCAIPEDLYTWPFQNVHFRLSYPRNSPDGLSMIRVSMCSISEQVGRAIFGYIAVC